MNVNFSPEETVVWSSTVQLKNCDGTKTLLTLSTSIPEQQSPVRLVKQHSRLSVPVLKSILQKSVRRRQPLPAVRVTMELLDKAAGPLLRRIPIILLEDSMLHPDFPLICWLMAAESKHYKIPLGLLSRVLQVVYESSTCPWSDCLGATAVNDCVTASENSTCVAMLNSMAMRVSYGGMACDMDMLRQYHKTLSNRFQTDTIPSEIRKRPGESAPTQWIDLLGWIHSKMRPQRKHHISSMLNESLSMLQLQDVCVEGVDFHCSSVLDQLTSDEIFASTCIDRLMQDGVLKVGSKDHLMAILKKCMWKYSSGVNYRQPLIGNIAILEEDPKLKLFWHDLVASQVKEFAARHISVWLVSSLPR
ncbi:hypothetical protein MHU86_581 [Fragilaria crotonensis]|nr:hypothetical protein MHU86_581 [Fragilaria crotonensis]